MIVYQRVCDQCQQVMEHNTQIRSVSGGLVVVARPSLTGPAECPVPQPADLKYAELCSDACAEKWWEIRVLNLAQPAQAADPA